MHWVTAQILAMLAILIFVPCSALPWHEEKNLFFSDLGQPLLQVPYSLLDIQRPNHAPNGLC